MADFNAEPYWDDFEATNGAFEQNYMRILFRPGYAVQARELTQIQSILQNQIKQFGDHIFKDGSPVIGGHLTLDTGISYVKLDQQFNGIDIDLEDFLGLTVFNNGSPKTRAKVIQTYSSTTDRTLLIRYLRGTAFTSSQTISTAGGSQANTVSANTTGTGSVVSINEGIFYVDGFFVRVAPQTIVLDPYSSAPSYRIGLQINDEVITESIDNALLDPAQESFNYQAPGAHRYQFSLDLTKRTVDSIDDRRFFELLRVENGVITKQVSYPIYSELEKTLARRTFDESGNYVVRPFRVNLSGNTPIGQAENTSSFIVNIEPGKGYVRGFEYETVGTVKLPAPRARTYRSNKDYDLSVYYGNRIQLTNVFGSANGIVFGGGLESLDIHCVANNGVVLNGNTANYYATRIGTAKIRNFDRAGTSTTYFAYLTDVDFQPIVTLTVGNAANTKSVNLAPYFSTVTDAYVNGTITLVNTTGAVGNSAKIVSYNAATKVAVVDKDFATTVVAGDQITISMPLGTSNGFIVPNRTTFAAANLQANVASTSKDALGFATIQDASYDSMVFKLPNDYIKWDSDTSVDFIRRNILRNQSFASNGAVTIGLTGSETFDFGTNGQLVSDADILENIIVVPTTGANAGTIRDLTAGAANVYRTSDQSITIYTDSGSGATFTGDIYLTTQITNANGNYRRVKSFVQSNSALTSYDGLASATAVTGFSEVLINASNGLVWFTSSNVVNKIPDIKQSLFLSDVVRIKKVYDSANISHAPNTTNMVDITERFAFDSGQRDGYYDHASIILRPGAQPPSGQTVVLLDYFTHSGSGYLSAKSYPSTLYDTEQIPIYKDSDGDLVNLRDAIDMRPLRVSGLVADPYQKANVNAKVNVSSGGHTVTANLSLTGNILVPPIVTGTTIKVNGQMRTVNAVINATAVTVSSPFTAAATNTDIEIITPNLQLTGGIIQRPTDSMELDYEFYLPRIDKVVVTKDKEFKVLQGIPSLVPQEPIEDTNSMAIYTMYIPPYTASVRSIDLRYIENRRYTMKDIALIDDRVKAIEEYVKLKESESQVINDPPKSPETPTINKPIYGTVVDEFNDLTIADVTNDFACSIEGGMLSCFRKIQNFGLQPTTPYASNIRDKFITLPFTETPMVTQGLYTNTKSEIVQTAIIAKFEGFATLTPESDYFYSLEHQPEVLNAFGRINDVPQKPKDDSPVITDTYVEQIGGGGYYRSEDYVLTGSSEQVQNQYTISIPAFSNLPTSFEPVYTQPLNIYQAGFAPMSALNSTWTGDANPAAINNINYFDGWNLNNSISAGFSFNLDQF
jgi:Domain of unknown function (DUF4815)